MYCTKDIPLRRKHSLFELILSFLTVAAMKCSLSIIVPSHNESQNLKRLLPELVETLSPLGDGYEIIVVDNASTDETQETLRILSQRFSNIRGVYEPEKGFGRALLRGLREGKGAVLGYIHADNQMSPEEIIRIYQKLVAHNLAVCKATRVNRNDGIWRFVVSKVYNVFFRLLFRVNMRDINGSPKMFTRKFFEDARLESLDWFIDPEIVIKAEKMKTRIGELEIRTFRRKSGVSQVRLTTILEFVKNMLRYWRK